MDDNQKNEYTSFNQDDRYDLGKWLYGVDNSQIMPEGPKAESKLDKFKKRVLTPVGIYLTIVAVLLPVWYLRTLVLTIRAGEPSLLLAWLPSATFTLFVCELILVFSIFGLWDKFMAFAVRKGAVKGKDADERRIIEQVKYAAGNIGRENAFTIYENYVVVKNNGKSRYIRRYLLESILVFKDKYQNFYNMIIELKSNESISVKATIPIADAYVLPDLLGDIVKIVEVDKDRKQKKAKIKNADASNKAKKTKVKRASKYDDSYFDNIVSSKFGYFDTNRIGGLVMGFIAIAAGIGIICMHVYLTPDIPWFLGAFFILGGMLAEFSVFDVFPIVSIFILPFMFGIMFTLMPVGICLLIYSVQVGDVMGLWQFISMFSPITCVVFMLTAIGIMTLIYSFVRVVKYLQYKKRR